MTSIDFAGARPSGPKVRHRETNWGVVVSENAQNKSTLAFAETMLRSLGLLIILCGGAVPFLGLPVLPTLGFALAFAFVGFSLYRYANNGFRTEVRIDTRFGKVRIGTVNAMDDFSEKRAFARSEVESFFIQRSTSRPARLCLRLKSRAQPMVLFAGPEDDLLPSFERIVEALFIKKGSGQRVQTRANDQFIHATFS